MMERAWESDPCPETAARYVATLQRHGTEIHEIRDVRLLDGDALFVIATKHRETLMRVADNAQGRPEFVHLPTGSVMVLIPAGGFMMGSHEGDEGDADEHPRHRVQIDYPMLVQKYPLTQGQWESVMGENPSHFQIGPSHPVESVSWHDCQEFGAKTGLELPSEAAWEYACRAGTTTRFHSAADDAPGEGGDTEEHIEKIAVYGRPWEEGHAPCFDDDAAPTRQPNDWGLCHMLGNVWEWCEDDWHSNYEGAPPDLRAWTEEWDREREQLLQSAVETGLIAWADGGYIVGPRWATVDGVKREEGDALDIDALNALLLRTMREGLR